MKYVLVTKKEHEVQPYVVEMFASLSIHEKADVSWAFSSIQDAIEVAEDLAKRNEAILAIFGDEATSEASKYVNVVAK